MSILIVPELQYVYLFGTGKVKVELKKKQNFGSFLGILDQMCQHMHPKIFYLFSKKPQIKNRG